MIQRFKPWRPALLMALLACALGAAPAGAQQRAGSLGRVVGGGADPSAPRDVSGIWRWSNIMPTGQVIDSTMTLYRSGNQFTGWVKGAGEVGIAGMTVSGGSVEFTLTQNAGGQTMELPMSGQLSGEQMSGKMSLGEGADAQTVEWKALRLKPFFNPTGAWIPPGAADAASSGTQLTLQLKGSTLTGSMRGGAGGAEQPLADLKIDGDTIAFTRPGAGGQPVVYYAAKVGAQTITGTERRGGPDKPAVPWSMQRAKGIASGTWRWTTTMSGLIMQRQADLEQVGDTLTGTVKLFDNLVVNIGEGHVQGDTVTFMIGIQGGNDNPVTSRYSGKIVGDRIAGTVQESDSATGQRSYLWSAQRISAQ